MTHFHAKYFAHSLTLKRSSGDIKSLSRSIANARVDLNPHQVHAALFALKSPLSMGAILADEVGLELGVRPDIPTFPFPKVFLCSGKCRIMLQQLSAPNYFKGVSLSRLFGKLSYRRYDNLS